MKLFPDLQPIESSARSFDIETPLGTITSYVTVNNHQESIKNASATYALVTSGSAAQWQLLHCHIEAVLTRPALIQEYWGQITDCWAFLWRVRVHQPIGRLQFVSHLHAHHPLAGGPDSGQYLDAQTWDNGIWMLSLGTEDGEALYERARSSNWLPQRYLTQAIGWGELPFVEYLPDGFSVTIDHVAVGDELQTQFVAAWAPYDPESASTWYAVDLDARHIIQGAKGVQVWT